jgi:hypothetical protein
MNTTQHNAAIARCVDDVSAEAKANQDSSWPTKDTVRHIVTVPHAHTDDVFGLIVVACHDTMDETMMPEIVLHTFSVIASRADRDAEISIIDHRESSTYDVGTLRDCWRRTAATLSDRGFTLTKRMSEVCGAHLRRYDEREAQVARECAEQQQAEIMAGA